MKVIGLELMTSYGRLPLSRVGSECVGIGCLRGVAGRVTVAVRGRLVDCCVRFRVGVGVVVVIGLRVELYIVGCCVVCLRRVSVFRVVRLVVNLRTWR